MKTLNKSKYYKRIQKANIGLFKRNRNSNLSFSIHPLTKKSPLTLIPEPLYNDFNRKSYKRHKIKFPINVPVYYRNIYVPREYNRYKPVKRTEFNYGHCTGNELLLSLMKYKDYYREEILEMFFQLSNKKNAKNLNLEENKIVKESFKSLFDQIEEMTVNEVLVLLKFVDKLNFKNLDIYAKVKKTIMSRIYNFESKKNSPDDLGFFILKIDEKVGFNQEETEELLEQIPRYLKKMEGSSVIALFELMLEKNFIKDPLDYLFEYHFFMYFWKKINNFTLPEMSRIIYGLKKLNYLKKDNDFLLDEFLPAISNAVKTVNNVEDIEEAMDVIESFVEEGIEPLELDFVKESFLKRINFIEKKMKVINESNIVFMVKSDIEKFGSVSREKTNVEGEAN